jgi:hypothetical protein
MDEADVRERFALASPVADLSPSADLQRLLGAFNGVLVLLQAVVGATERVQKDAHALHLLNFAANVHCLFEVRNGACVLPQVLVDRSEVAQMFALALPVADSAADVQLLRQALDGALVLLQADIGSAQVAQHSRFLQRNALRDRIVLTCGGDNLAKIASDGSK